MAARMIATGRRRRNEKRAQVTQFDTARTGNVLRGVADRARGPSVRPKNVPARGDFRAPRPNGWAGKRVCQTGLYRLDCLREIETPRCGRRGAGAVDQTPGRSAPFHPSIPEGAKLFD